MTITIDARGKACPEPVLMTRKALQETDVTQLEILVDNDAALENVSRMARSNGCEVTMLDKSDGTFALVLKREQGAEPLPLGTNTENAAITCTNPSPVAVLISSDTIGTGDDQLGRLLMVAFIKTIKEIETKPTVMAFMNGGVKLTTDGSELVDALKELENMGVELLVCGTCLDFFTLKEKLKVGKISNMFDITTSLTEADKILRP